MNYCWMQPPKTFGAWKARGVDSIVWPSLDNVTPAAWCDQADAAKLSYVLPSDGQFDQHYARAGCAGAILNIDEPNSGRPGDPGYFSPGKMMDLALSVRAKTPKPVWISLAGWVTQWQGDQEIAAFCACADIVSWDIYPCNLGLGPGGFHFLADITDRLKRLAPGKRIVCDVETCDQHIPPGVVTPPVPGEKYRGPTVSEIGDEVTLARAHGAEVLYFSHDSGPPWKSHDATTPEASGAITILNRHA